MKAAVPVVKKGLQHLKTDVELKILKKDAVISNEEREEFYIPFSYIANHSKEISELNSHFAELNSNLDKSHKTCLQLAKRIDEGAQQYHALNEAINRFKRLMDDVNTFSMETEHAWDELQQVEQRLLQHPKFSGSKTTLDELLS